MNSAGVSFYAQCTGMRKFPELSSYNVFISSPHRELHMKGSWLRDQKSVAAGMGPSLVDAGFSQPVFVAQWLVISPHLSFLSHILFILVPGGVILGILLSSQDPVYLLTSNYSCAELLKNEMSSNKQSGCPLTCMVYHYFASSQLFEKQQLFRLLTGENFDVSGYVILAFFVCCWMTCCNLADELCQIERSRQLLVGRGHLVITSWLEECSQWLLSVVLLYL